MNPHTLRVLEFEAIRERLVGLASCSLGQERAAEMQPSTREDEVRNWQRQTSEAVRLMEAPGGIPLGGIHDIRPAVKMAGIGGMLEPGVLLTVADTAAAARKLKAHLLEREESVPLLAELARQIQEFKRLEQVIYEVISEQAEVRDEASPTLSRLRRELRVVRARMMDRLNNILRSTGYRDMIQDPVVTTREGRFCIPVKSEYRSAFGGLVHDQSSSGATVFMEPTPVVELGNELRQVEMRERQEVERILRELAGHVASAADDLNYTTGILAELDFIFSRGRLSQAMDAVEPEINKDCFIGLRRARHPLLEGSVVPIDVDLGREHTIVVITGPNTGGKTVSLKTVGLLALMAQCGLHIPAHEGSTLGVFRGIYADIGDEQSIQQSLSTFSGHITNIARILKEVEFTGARSLVLMDEVGAGTDPAEGGALAKAILQKLLQKKAKTIATTHYGELKEFAYSTPGVQNASVEFDLQTLRPTYRLLIGVPGTSNAFSIAARLGLPGEIVQAAQEMIGTDRAVLSDVIQKLTENQRASEVDVQKAALGAREIESRREQLERDARKLEADRREILAKARAEAEELVRAARREMDRVKDELKRVEKTTRRAAAEPVPDPEVVQKARERLQATGTRMEHRAQKVARRVEVKAPVVEEPLPYTPQQGPLEVGDSVWIAALNQRGTLLTLPVEGKAQVQIGPMRTTVPADSLQRVAAPAAPPRPAPVRATSEPDLRMRAHANIRPEVQLRGMRAEEALMQLDEYVDQACLAGFSPFRIVHGKGTGALKRVVWEFLQSHPSVAGYRHPPEEEGGSGVTVVDLKD